MANPPPSTTTQTGLKGSPRSEADCINSRARRVPRRNSSSGLAAIFRGLQQQAASLDAAMLVQDAPGCNRHSAHDTMPDAHLGRVVVLY
jgi:hypothetical protein